MALLFQKRHNQVGCLAIDFSKAITFRPMIEFLQRSRIHYALTANPEVYSVEINSFWQSATVEENVIRATVAGLPIQVTEQVVREVLQFQDNPGDPIEFDINLIHGCFHRMGYNGNLEEGQYRKTCLSPRWRYLMHLLIQCISQRKAGFDAVGAALASGMIGLTLNKAYNFSAFVYGNMKTNVVAGNHKWLMYPRFVQLIINHLLPEL